MSATEEACHSETFKTSDPNYSSSEHLIKANERLVCKMGQAKLRWQTKIYNSKFRD